jgi:hypothetical protein
VSRSAALDRLCDIARPRTIRRPLLVPVPAEGFPIAGPKTKIEWPIPR